MATAKYSYVTFVKNQQGPNNLVSAIAEVNSQQNTKAWDVYTAISFVLKLYGKNMPVAASLFDMAAAAEQDYLERLEDFYTALLSDMNGGSNLASITVTYKFTSFSRDGGTVWKAEFPTAQYNYA